MAGVLLGPVHHLVHPSAEIAVFGQLGALLLLFVAGIKEIRFKDIMKNQIATVGIAFLGYLFPFIAVLFVVANVGVLIPGVELGLTEILLAAAALSTSAIITTVKTLIDLNKINSAGARVLLGASILDSFLGLFVFTIVITFAVIGLPSLPKAVGITALTIAFFLVFYLAEKAIPELIARSKFLEVEEAQFTMVFVVMLGLVWLAEIFGLNGIIGAFFAGIIISKTQLSESAFYEKVGSMTYGIFVPIFFAWVGLMIEPQLNMLVVVLLAVIAATNLIGAYIGSWLGNLDEGDALLVGIGMIPRGGVDLVIITSAMSLGLLGGAAGSLIFSSVVMVVMISIIITPLLLHAFFGSKIQYT